MRKEYRRNKAKEKFVNYLIETWQNKLCAAAMIITTMLGVMFMDDATALLFVLPFAVQKFFSKKKWIS